MASHDIPGNQGSVEHANGDIKDMLVAWMSENRTQDWSVGLHFVQNMKNPSFRYQAHVIQSHV